MRINTSKIMSVTVAVLFILSSCKAPQMFMAVPEQFKAEAEKMPIAGLGNGTGKKGIDFGSYNTSRISRGWNMTTSREDRNTNISSEERVLRAFKIDRRSITNNQKDKFKFTINDGKNTAEVFALERKVSEETRITTNNRWLSELSDPKNFQYSFSAVILLQSVSQPSTWNLSLYSSFENKAGRNRFDMTDTNGVNEGGILSNEKDTIIIKSINSQNLVSEKGEARNLPFKMPTGYELAVDDNVIAVIDFWGKVIWMNSKLGEHKKIAIAAASSAILLRRIHNKIALV